MDPVAVVGAGAVGCYFGGMLARAGVPVVLIGRFAHMEVIGRDGLLLETQQFTERVRVFVTSTEIEEVRRARTVLFCVKSGDTAETARRMWPYLSSNCSVISMQNGVDNAARIREATDADAIPAVVYVAAAMVAPGHVKHSGRGDLVLPESAASIARMFESAGVPCRLSPSIESEVWKKMVMNCAYNAISALGKAQYGRMVAVPRIRDLGSRAIAETVAVARAEGVELSEPEMVDAALKLGKVMSGATSSTAQDIARGKTTEIASLNGYIARRGVELGIPVPVNETLTALIELLSSAG